MARTYICPTHNCTELAPDLTALLDHLDERHDMRGWTCYVTERRMVWAKTGQDYPLIWVDEEDLALRPSHEVRAMGMMLDALSQPRRDLRQVDAELRAMGYKGGLS